MNTCMKKNAVQAYIAFVIAILIFLYFRLDLLSLITLTALFSMSSHYILQKINSVEYFAFLDRNLAEPVPEGDTLRTYLYVWIYCGTISILMIASVFSPHHMHSAASYIVSIMEPLYIGLGWPTC